MSLVTIEKNRDSIIAKLKEIEVLANENAPDLFNKYIMSQCCLKQHEWVRDNLLTKYVKDRHYADDYSGYSLVNNFFGFMYMHNYIAIMDEIYEAKDAQLKYKTNFELVQKEMKKGLDNREAIESAKDKLNLAGKLVIEELIDVFHFLLQYTTLLQQHQLVTLELNQEHSVFRVEDLEYWLTNKGDNLGKFVSEHIERAGKHIDLTDIQYDNYSINSIYNYFSLNDGIYDFFNKFDDVLDDLIELNRNFIRETNFKGWKEYPDNFYSVVKFTNLQNYVLKMYNVLLNCAIPIYSFVLADFMPIETFQNSKSFFADIYVDDVTAITTKYEIYDINTIMKVVYAIYLAKRDENIRRQQEDSRYKLNNHGGAVGDEVK